MKTNYLEVVEELNQELYDKHKEEIYLFNYRSYGWCEAIFFEDTCLWDSDNDGREFIEEINDYEPLLPFIKKEFNKHIKHLSKLKL